ncbi:hypothetical protein ABID29_001936 [Streptococcus rupicaprae]|uniref:Uncharacterized protein n=1 Tax=Streptococcus rupicaprae TaxID=759619 RepID=A0ABV2FJX3_9STRE
MCQKNKQKQETVLPVFLLNVATFLSFTLPRTNLAATTLSGWGINLLSLFQLGIMLALVIKSLR